MWSATARGPPANSPRRRALRWRTAAGPGIGRLPRLQPRWSPQPSALARGVALGTARNSSREAPSAMADRRWPRSLQAGLKTRGHTHSGRGHSHHGQVEGRRGVFASRVSSRADYSSRNPREATGHQRGMSVVSVPTSGADHPHRRNARQSRRIGTKIGTVCHAAEPVLSFGPRSPASTIHCGNAR